ncbi:potassium channel family protein [Nocardioides sp. NBC_00850]|uniref:ion channel n=1 Tax=Nocardioides sp. NBC_00850 TaxID=2976001 RepID=UPI0038634FDE|nr:potassium channel family protein [Nocardioides sp. NBC_00850]
MAASRRQTWKLGLLLMLRVTLSVGALFAAYYLIPTRTSGGISEVVWLVICLCAFAAIVGLQILAIVQAKFPILRAVEAMAVLVPLYLLIFARVYLWNSLQDPSAFTEPLDDTTALYFTVTVFATVGFGDIFAETNSMRLLVTLQMILNLVVLGLVIRLVTSAARRGVARRDEERQT